MSLFSELKRRNVIRVATAYVVASWLIIQVVETILPAFGYSDVAIRYIVIVLAIAFIPTLVLSWVFEITPEGIKREVDVIREHSITRFTGKRLDSLIMVLLALALGYFAFDKFILGPSREAVLVEETSQQVRSEMLAETYGDKSIVVLPFVNMSEDPEQEYLSDGFAEELIALLSKISELRVIAPSSTRYFKGKDFDTASIAELSGANHILEGSVRHKGDQLRITTKLIDAERELVAWADSYDFRLEEIFEVQKSVAVRVAEALQVSLLGKTFPVITETDPQAYALLLQAHFFTNTGSFDGFQRAHECLEQALTIDPAFAPAWAELGKWYMNQAAYGLLSPEEGKQQALQSLDRAISLDPANAIAYSRKAWLMSSFFDDFESAVELTKTALQLEPHNGTVLANASDFLRMLERFDESIVLSERLLLIDPIGPVVLNNLGLMYITVGRYDKAEAALRKVLSISPNRIAVRGQLARVLTLDHRPEEALEAIKNEPYEPSRLIATALALQALGQMEESAAALETLKANYSENRGYWIAMIYSARDEVSQALDWLNRAYVKFGPSVILDAKNNPEFENLRSDPNWQTLLDDVESFEKRLAAIEFDIYSIDPSPQ